MTRRDRLAALGQWLLLGSLVGVLCGAASALFLWLLERATEFRTGHEVIVYTLPVAGLVIGWIYERFGQSIKAGNNLVIDTIHDEGPEIPPTTLPTCVELVGPVAVLEAFVDANRDELADAVLLRLDGINVSLRGIPA